MKRFLTLTLLSTSILLGLRAQTIFPGSADKRNYAVITMKDGSVHEGYLASYVTFHKTIELRKTRLGAKKKYKVMDMESFVLMYDDHSDPDSLWIPMIVGTWKGEGKVDKKLAYLMRKNYDGRNITGYYFGFMDSTPAHPTAGGMMVSRTYYRHMYFIQRNGEDWVLQYPDVDKGLTFGNSGLWRKVFKRYPELVEMIGTDIKKADVKNNPLIFMYKLDELLDQKKTQ